MENGKSYGARIRLEDGSSVVQQVTTVAGEQSSFTFTAAVGGSPKPQAGDLVQLGILGSESVAGIVKLIEPSANLTARVSLLDANFAVLDADAGPIPAWSSNITRGASISRMLPPAPIMDSIRSDESVLLRDLDGSLSSRIALTFHFTSGLFARPDLVTVRFKRSGADAGQYQHVAEGVGGDSVEVSLRPVEDGATYDIIARSETFDGRASDWVTLSTHTVVGKTTKPADVSDLRLDSFLLIANAKLRWSYPAPPPDFAGFRVKSIVGNFVDWSLATPAHDGLLTEAQFVIGEFFGTRTYMVKAVDVAGNESETPVSTTVFFGDLTPVNLLIQQDHRALGWPGTIVNGSVSAGDLVADSLTPFWSTDATALFWRRNSDLMWTGSYKEMTYTADMMPSVADVGSTLALNATVSQATAWLVEYRFDSAPFWAGDEQVFWTTDSALFWTSAGAFLPWPGFIAGVTRQTYQVRITTKSGAVQGKITAATFLWAVATITENFDDFAIASGGSRLPITQVYRAIKNVKIGMLVGNQTGAVGARAVDKDAVLGPLIEAWDAQKLPVAAVSDIQIEGY